MPGYGIYSKLLRPDRTAEESNDDAWDQAIDESVVSIGIHPPGSRLEETLKQNNAWTLGGGTYPPFSFSAPHGIVSAASAGARFGQRCSIRAHTSVFGVTFSDDSDEGAIEIVHVGSDTAARFVGCTFVRSPSSPFNHVRVDGSSGVSGSVAGTVVFIGCTFINGGSTAIDNAGAAARVQAIGCVNMTGNVRLDGTTAPFPVEITETGTIGI